MCALLQVSDEEFTSADDASPTALSHEDKAIAEHINARARKSERGGKGGKATHDVYSVADCGGNDMEDEVVGGEEGEGGRGEGGGWSCEGGGEEGVRGGNRAAREGGDNHEGGGEGGGNHVGGNEAVRGEDKGSNGTGGEGEGKGQGEDVGGWGKWRFAGGGDRKSTL